MFIGKSRRCTIRLGAVCRTFWLFWGAARQCLIRLGAPAHQYQPKLQPGSSKDVGEYLRVEKNSNYKKGQPKVVDVKYGIFRFKQKQIPLTYMYVSHIHTIYTSYLKTSTKNKKLTNRKFCIIYNVFLKNEIIKHWDRNVAEWQNVCQC